MISNTYKTTAKIWKSFKTETAKQVYNAMMRSTLKNKASITHPKMPEITQTHWKTICHNQACYAAWAVDAELLLLLVEPKFKKK